MRAWPLRAMLAFGLLAALPACTEAPLVRVRIAYSGFEPACVTLSAQAAGEAEATSVPVRVPEGSRGGELVAVIYRQPGWANQLLVTVVAHERTCDGPVVAQDRSTVTLQAGTTVTFPLRLDANDGDGDGYVAAPPGTDCDDALEDVHPDAGEVCNLRDDDCDNAADDGFNLGAACGGDGGCASRVQCAGDGGTFCAPGQAWYRDGDMDGWGRTQSVEFSCTRPDASFVLDGGDCNDGTPRVAPGLPEVCDSQDNNCAGGPDEGLGVGGGCSTPLGCPGQISCETDAGTTCRSSGDGGLHPDDDGDGAGALMEVCAQDGGVPTVTNADDCDDGDPFTALGFPEICDRRDNDCDGQVDRTGAADASACPASPTWVPTPAGGGGHDWKSISSWADGGAWAVGLGGRCRVHLPSDAYGVAWTSFDNRCPTGVDYAGVWADPASGQAYVVGPTGSYGVHEPAAAVFLDHSALVGPSLGDPVSVVGIRSGASLELYVVGQAGGSVRWLPDGGSQALASMGARLNDVHGISPDVMFAAGAQASPPDARLFRFNPGSGGWTATPVPVQVRNTPTAVHAVHAVSPRLAYAVTDAGHVLRWDGAAWDLHPSPTDAGLRGVLAFGKSSVFVIEAKSAWEWNGTTWTKLFDAATPSPGLVDLHGTHPGDIWIAQEPQMIYHWPR